MSRKEEDKPTNPSVSDGISSISTSDFTFAKIAAIPCAKSSFITGLLAGAVLGTARFFATRRVTSANNFALGTT